jgi:hypothetical protein
MKKLIFPLVVAVLLLLSLNLKAQYGPKEYRLHHFSAGYVTGIVTQFYFKKPFVYPVLISTGLGVLKESYDVSKGAKFSADDVLFTAIGGVVGSFITSNTRELFKRKKKKQIVKI